MATFVRRIAFALVALLLLAGCDPAGPTATPLPPTATAPPSATVAPTATPLPQPEPLPLLSEWIGPPGPVYTVDWSPDGRRVVTTARERVTVWDGETYEELATLAGFPGFVHSARWSPDGSLLAVTGGGEQLIRLYDTRTYTEQGALSGQWAYLLDWSPDGRLLAAGGEMSRRVWVWDVEAGAVSFELQCDDAVSGLAWSPDGSILAVGQFDASVVLWNVRTRTRLQRLVDGRNIPNENEALSLSWSPDGRLLAYIQRHDGRYRVWDTQTGELVLRVAAQNSQGFGVAWSPNRPLLASVGWDRVVRIWDIPTGQLVGAGECSALSVRSVDWSPDGQRIAVGSGVTRHWDHSEIICVMEVPAGIGTDSPVPPTHTPIPPTALPTPTPTVSSAADTWFRTYGGSGDDVAWGVLLADDGGYYIVGTTHLEFEPQMRGDVYLIRTDAAGEVLWERRYERDGYAEGSAIAWASDGNLLISGPASSVTTNGTDIYLLRVDPAGNELGFHTFDGPLDEMGSAWPLADGGYLLAGNAVDPNDVVADPGAAGYGGMAGRSNIYLARVDADGNELWSRTYGGESNVLVFDGLPMEDGGLLLLATIMYYPENDDDIYLLRVDADGNELWSQTWEEGLANAAGLAPTGDGNYLILGSYSPPEVMDRTATDFLFIEVDAQGNELWRRVWGDPDANDDAAVLTVTADGGCVAAGDTGGDLSSWNQDIVLLKLDSEGQLLWRQVIATGTHQMYGRIVQHPDGGYVLVGSLVRNGQFDIFLIKTDAQGSVELR